MSKLKIWLQLNSEVIAAVKYHCVLETPKTLGTNILVKTLKDVPMDNQQETKIISHIMSRIFRDYAWYIYFFPVYYNIFII